MGSRMKDLRHGLHGGCGALAREDVDVALKGAFGELANHDAGGRMRVDQVRQQGPGTGGPGELEKDEEVVRRVPNPGLETAELAAYA